MLPGPGEKKYVIMETHITMWSELTVLCCVLSETPCYNVGKAQCNPLVILMWDQDRLGPKVAAKLQKQVAQAFMSFTTYGHWEFLIIR